MAAKCLSSLFLLWLKQKRQPIYTTQQAQHSSLAIGLVGLSELSWALAGMSWGELRWAKVKWSYEHTCRASCVAVFAVFACSAVQYQKYLPRLALWMSFCVSIFICRMHLLFSPPTSVNQSPPQSIFKCTRLSNGSNDKVCGIFVCLLL